MITKQMATLVINCRSFSRLIFSFITHTRHWLTNCFFFFLNFPTRLPPDPITLYLLSFSLCTNHHHHHHYPVGSVNLLWPHSKCRCSNKRVNMCSDDDALLLLTTTGPAKDKTQSPPKTKQNKQSAAHFYLTQAPKFEIPFNSPYVCVCVNMW